MIRWLLAILVLVNVALFMWGSWYKDANRSGWPVVRAAVNPERCSLSPIPRLRPRCAVFLSARSSRSCNRLSDYAIPWVPSRPIKQQCVLVAE